MLLFNHQIGYLIVLNELFRLISPKCGQIFRLHTCNVAHERVSLRVQLKIAKLVVRCCHFFLALPLAGPSFLVRSLLDLGLYQSGSWHGAVDAEGKGLFGRGNNVSATGFSETPVIAWTESLDHHSGCHS